MYEVKTLVSQRKRELGKALLKMSADAESEIAKGEYTLLEHLKKEIETEGK